MGAYYAKTFTMSTKNESLACPSVFLRRESVRLHTLEPTAEDLGNCVASSLLHESPCVDDSRTPKRLCGPSAEDITPRSACYTAPMQSVVRFDAMKFVPLLLLGLFFGLTFAPPGIYNTEFLLSRGLTSGAAGFMFLAGSLVSIVLLALLPTLLLQFGARRVALALASLVISATVGLALFPGTAFTIFFFLLFWGMGAILYSLLDLFIEQKIDGAEGITGRVRGIYLTLINVAYTIGPFIAALIITLLSFAHLYAFAALMCFIFLMLLHATTRSFTDPKYPRVNLHYIIRTALSDRLAAKVFIINFLLQLRYAVVIMYLAVYLHQALGFPLVVVGFMVSVANIPFLFIQFPLGLIADRYLGEKEITVIGFIMTCAGAFALAFTTANSIFTMTAILMLMFTGAAVIEIMSESYFFKHIKSRDDAHFAAFRMLSPLSYIIAPILATAIMFFLPMNFIFAAVALICLLGIPLALSLKDTR